MVTIRHRVGRGACRVRCARITIRDGRRRIRRDGRRVRVHVRVRFVSVARCIVCCFTAARSAESC